MAVHNTGDSWIGAITLDVEFDDELHAVLRAKPGLAPVRYYRIRQQLLDIVPGRSLYARAIARVKRDDSLPTWDNLAYVRCWLFCRQTAHGAYQDLAQASVRITR